MKRLFLPLLIVLLLAGCQSQPVSSEIVSVNDGSYQNIEADALNTMLQEEDFVLVNVHIPFAGNIAGTDLSIPYNEIQPHISELPADKDAKIVLYCSSGRMSQMAAEELVSLGYTKIWNLKGGMVEWKEAGFAIEK